MSIFYGESECIMPEGEFLDSCRNFELKPYHSTDNRVPILCRFEAECDDEEGITPVENVVYLPTNTKLTEVSNVLGYLTYGMKLLSNKVAKLLPCHHSRIMGQLRGHDRGELVLTDSSDLPFIAPPKAETKSIAYSFTPNSHTCLPLSGSYIHTCETVISRYISTDKNLEDTELCEAQLNCARIISNITSNTVYFNLANKNISETSTVQRLENCDGALIIGNLDHQCNGKDPSHIQNLAKRQGQIGKIKL